MKKDGITNLGYIAKANSLIQLNRYVGGSAGTSLSLLEAKLFAFAISGLDQQGNTLHPVEFSVQDFWLACGIVPQGKRYRDIMYEALQSLSDKSGWVVHVDPETGQTEEVLVRLVQKPRLRNSGQICEIQFDQDMAPALLQLKSNYTQYRVAAVMRMTSKYGFALYEMLLSYEHLHQPLKFSFDELASRLDATHYDRTSSLKMRVIDPAIKDINDNAADIQVSAAYEKTARAYSHVTFYLSRKNGVCASIGDEDHLAAGIQEAREQLDYDAIRIDIMAGRKPYNPETLELIIDIVAEVLTSPKKTYSINGNPISGTKVQERFRMLTMEHAEHVMQRLAETQKSIRSPISYLRSALFNAPMTIDICVTSQVNADFTKPKPSQVVPSMTLGAAEIEAIQMILSDN